MPWNEVKPMDEKVCFIADCLRHHNTMVELCDRYGISRKTGYKWLHRYHHAGLDGLTEQSRRPRTHPATLPYRLRQAIIELRTATRLTPGAKKIQALLANRFPNEVIPSQTTIYHVLRAEHLVHPRKIRQRVPPGRQPFAPVTRPNDCWSVDFKGQFRTRNGQWCYPLTVMDHHSRYLLTCHSLTNTGVADTQRRFTRLFRRQGLPQRIRSDNGVPFATRAAGGLSRLSIWWVKLGIVPERIAPGKPQQNGRHERMHRTLKQATTHPPSTTLRAQQRQFDRFQTEYNEQRPHEALGQHTPASVYVSSSRPYPARLPELHYPDYFERRLVRASGVIYRGNGQVYVSHQLNGEIVGLEEVDDGLWDVYFGPIRLGRFNIREVKGRKTSYWSLKV